jgi:hypothetical protein
MYGYAKHILVLVEVEAIGISYPGQFLNFHKCKQRVEECPNPCVKHAFIG